VNTAHPDGQALYLAAIERYAIPYERRGVPTLIIDDTVLVGSYEIPEYLPGLIEHHLASGGVDWPDIPGLAELMPETGEETDNPGEPTPASTTPPQSSPDAELNNVPDDQASLLDRFSRDPLGNSLSIVVLIGMVASLPATAVRLVNLRARGAVLRGIERWRTWIVTVLCAVGLGIALYLAYVETTQTLAVCGPVGDCNTVQQSQYARLFGLLPVGVLGAVGYLLILAAWWLGNVASGDLKDWAVVSVFGMALSGTLFSVYLTFLEPFIIGATCAWCLSSAVLMTLILLLVTDGAASAWSALIRVPRRKRRRAAAPEL
jgi:uncharacterized membrane protein